MTTPMVTFGCNFNVEGNDEYWDIAEFAQRAEKLGLDRVSIGEHIMELNPSRPTILSIPAMACAAGATSTLRVMTGIVIAPLYHPLVLSKMVSTLDLISKGRLDFGIGISGQRETQVEFEALDIQVQTRGRRTDEILEVMKRLWTEEQVSHHGDFFKFEGVSLLPAPVQLPHPPIWVAGRSDASMRRAALLGNGWYPYLFTVQRLKASNETVRKIAAEAGRDLTNFHWGLAQPIAISNRPREASALAVENVGKRYVTPDRTADDIARALCIAGTPKDCIKGIEERIDVGTRDFNMRFLAPDSVSLYRQMETFATQVIPYFRS